MYKTKLETCGLASKYASKECPESTYCEISDFWIKGLSSKPFSRAICGAKGKTNPMKDDKCTPICRDDRLKGYENMLKKELKEIATDQNKIEKCLNDGSVTTIASAAIRTCSTDDCNQDNCKEIDKSKCASNPSQTKKPTKHPANGKTTGKHANGKTTGKHANGKTTGKPANGSVTLAPNGTTNGTKNGTASAGTTNAEEIMGINKFAITFFINAFLGSWVIIAFLF